MFRSKETGMSRLKKQRVKISKGWQLEDKSKSLEARPRQKWHSKSVGRARGQRARAARESQPHAAETFEDMAHTEALPRVLM